MPKKRTNHERRAVALFIAAILFIVGWAVLKDPKVVGYATARNSIEVINPQSYTNVNDYWQIRFFTKGQGDLRISEVKESFYSLSKPEIRCGDELIDYEYDSTITINDYRCDEVGSITAKVKKEGIQKLRINFCNEVYVTNFATKKENI
ncbi:MAG: hypothetical protein QXR60_02415 [Candidatus Nanoarchaeia archaeon]